MKPRKKPAAPVAYASNRAAADAMVAKLRAAGALDAVDDALVHGFLALADAVDEVPGKADLWREYRAFGQALREVVAGGSDDDTAQFLLTVQTPRAKVGNAKKS